KESACTNFRLVSAFALQPVAKWLDRSDRHDDLGDLADLVAGQILAQIAAMNLRNLVLGTLVVTDHFQNRVRVDIGVVAGLDEKAAERVEGKLALPLLWHAPFETVLIEEVSIVVNFRLTLRLPLDVRSPIWKRLGMTIL